MKNTSKDLTEQEFLNEYDITKFDRPSVTVDILILSIINEDTDNYRKLINKNLNILLIKRLEHPFKGKWALPGGFVKLNESLETTAYRELKEETNVSDVYLEQLYTYGNLNRDPRGRIISSAYMSLIDSKKVTPQAGTDAIETRWFKVYSKVINTKKETTQIGVIELKDHEISLVNDDIVLKSIVRVEKKTIGHQEVTTRRIISNDDLAFDHAEIIQYGIERLRSKIEYTSIVFNLMPELFTLSELQMTYEKILGKELLKANFRRKVAKKVIETSQVTGDNIGHRPAKLFKFNPCWNKD